MSATDKTAAVLEHMADNHNSVQFGIEISAALERLLGTKSVPPFTLVFALPDGTLTRFTNLDPKMSLVMLADLLRGAMEEGKEKIIMAQATRQ